MMKTKLIAIVLFLLLLSACSLSTASPMLSEPTTTQTATTTQVATTAAPEISEKGKEILRKNAKYAIHGITLELPMEDMKKILGDISEIPNEGDPNYLWYPYENVQFETSPFIENGNVIASCWVYSGKYLGITIGESTTEDVTQIFGELADADTYYDYSTGHDYLFYRDPENDLFNIWFQLLDGIVTRITVDCYGDM
jgi:hypothetical protein